ncbi:MAG TPA: rhodanese-like domain-containing protein [Candidatus Acidoferrales bacterium]|jgi:rhodanese-related sulfurtransferase|nr:rhodanese-like domain-containing protein [Candidatus Acidoferrales bacterium]
MLPQFMKLVEEAKRDIQEIDVRELRQKLPQGGFTLIDVREAQEVARGKINGAVAIPRGVLELQIDQVVSNFGEPIVLYCGGGNRSALAAQSLKKMGFTSVSSLAGGWKAWTESGGG